MTWGCLVIFDRSAFNLQRVAEYPALGVFFAAFVGYEMKNNNTHLQEDLVVADIICVRCCVPVCMPNNKAS